MIPRTVCYEQLSKLMKQFPRHEAPMILQIMERSKAEYIPNPEAFEVLIAHIKELDQCERLNENADQRLVIHILEEMLKAWGIVVSDE